MYTVKARYYSGKDNLGETFVLASDNGEADLKLEVGQKIFINAISGNVIATCRCGGEASVKDEILRYSREDKDSVYVGCDKCEEFSIADKDPDRAIFNWNYYMAIHKSSDKTLGK